MRRFPIIISALIAMAMAIGSCSSDTPNYWEDYTEYRNANLEWLKQQYEKKDADGKPFYTEVRPTWDQGSYVLMHYYNDTMLTKDNLKPHYTSTVDVKYHGRLIDGTPFDSSFVNTSPADSIFRTGLNEVISGWTIALEKMHVGDSCEIVIPYEQGYGSTGSGSIAPYSVLVFGVKLVDIYKLDKK